jgi:hypothetical protein
MFNAKIVENFLSKDVCEFIVNSVKDISPWESGGDDFWDNRSLNIRTLFDKGHSELAKILINTKDKVKKEIEEAYGQGPVYSDLFQVVRWFPGMEQPPHADDMTNVEGEDDLEWFAHRNFGAIIYLNDDYSGGETFYPQHEISISPEAGKLAVHPGTPDHMHGVTKIENETRYTLASFWTFDKEFADEWSIS